MKVSRLRPTLSVRRFLLAVGHIVVFACSYLLAFAIRRDFVISPEASAQFTSSVAWVCLLKLVVFYTLGHFHGWWRFITFADLVGLLRAATLSLVLIASMIHFLNMGSTVSRSVLVLDWACTILILGAVRSTWRLYHEMLLPLRGGDDVRRAVFLGADVSGRNLAQHIQSDPRLNYRICGFVDSDEEKVGSRLGGIPVVAGLQNVADGAVRVNATDVLLPDGLLSGDDVRRVMEQCDQAELNLKVIPSVHHVLNSSARSRVDVRDVDIHDLLGREPVELDCERIGKMLRGRTVMVTGAGGSIGSEICRQVLKFAPKMLVLVERFENNLFVIDRELRQTGTTVPLAPCIADVVDQSRLGQVFASHEVDVVFHAAAHKHVPMMELNPGEAVKNNVFGTRCVAGLADEFGVETFVLISSDKAVNPSSVMGMTKQMAERVVYGLSQQSKTCFVVVRFGNVLGSAGSVIPIFQEQIRSGGPITVTHPEMRRYFMTIPEASRLVLQAAADGRNGEILVLDMGKPVRIVDLATDLLRISGLSADQFPIVFTGVRPGEKLEEELYFQEEELLPSEHPKIHSVCHRPYSVAEIESSIQTLADLQHSSPKRVRQTLERIVFGTTQWDAAGGRIPGALTSTTLDLSGRGLTPEHRLADAEHDVSSRTK